MPPSCVHLLRMPGEVLGLPEAGLQSCPQKCVCMCVCVYVHLNMPAHVPGTYVGVAPDL